VVRLVNRSAFLLFRPRRSLSSLVVSVVVAFAELGFLRYVIRSSSILASAKNFFFVDLARVFLSQSFSIGLFVQMCFRLGYGIGVDARLLPQALPKRHSALKTQDHLDAFSAYGRLACARLGSRNLDWLGLAWLGTLDQRVFVLLVLHVYSYSCWHRATAWCQRLSPGASISFLTHYLAHPKNRHAKIW